MPAIGFHLLDSIRRVAFAWWYSVGVVVFFDTPAFDGAEWPDSSSHLFRLNVLIQNVLKAHYLDQDNVWILRIVPVGFFCSTCLCAKMWMRVEHGKVESVEHAQLLWFFQATDFNWFQNLLGKIFSGYCPKTGRFHSNFLGQILEDSVWFRWSSETFLKY